MDKLATSNLDLSADLSGATVVDVDVHHEPEDMVSALGPYLSKTYRERLDDYGYVGAEYPYAFDGGKPSWIEELDTGSGNSNEAAIHWLDMTSRYLDDHRVDIAVLTGGPLYAVPTMTDLDYASSLCSAFNDWTLQTWTSADRRYRSCIAINPQDPFAAAREIDRVASDDAICGVLLPSGSPRPYGQRFFDPLIDTASNHGLPLVIHVGGDGLGTLGEITPSGTPSFLIEQLQATPGFVQGHLASFIFEGVFTRHPDLRVVILGAGFGWLPSYMWRMDEDWKGLRWSTPWVEDLPSKYVSKHIRIGTHPRVDMADPTMMSSTLDWIEAKKTLMFASHFPEWDSAPPDGRLSDDRDVSAHILGRTALETFGLSSSL